MTTEQPSDMGFMSLPADVQAEVEQVAAEQRARQKDVPVLLPSPDRQRRTLVTAAKPRPRPDVFDKPTLFVGGCLHAAFSLFGLAVLLLGHSWSPLVAALFLDGVGVLAFGLYWVARRLFPEETL